ncbi:putative F-box/LRR-repeat protein At5g41840 [Rutidosis leptorrhynchoides]|uniref:putative F-box/LRR-repeat protein At5g41840 n=1 Tax=Rutidosis leptorrhynchoides TaxID=125765 RepID=UPI003A994D84
MDKLQRRSQHGGVSLELIQHIQTLLPVKQAARTCVFSETWSHAWSTIPNLRFDQTLFSPTEGKKSDYKMFMDRTMSKYVRDNIPIESFDLKLDDMHSVSLIYEWIRTVAARPKELSIHHQSYESEYLLPGEIFSGKYLHTLSIKNSSARPKPLINCVSLRVLKLSCVKISEDVLHTLFSTCTLLEKIEVSNCIDLKTIKVRNLRYLQRLTLETSMPFDVLKIDDVPNLCLFYYHVVCVPMKIFNMAFLSSVTELSLHGVTIDVAFLDMIKFKLPFLEILDFNIMHRTLEKLDFTSSSLKRLTSNKLGKETDWHTSLCSKVTLFELQRLHNA